MVIPMDATVVLQLRAALQESQIRVAHLERKLTDTSEALQLAAYEIAPLRRLAEVVSALDLIQQQMPLEGEGEEADYLRALEAKDKALRFYRQSIDPKREELVRGHSRSITLQLGAKELEQSGEAGMWHAVSWLRSQADLAVERVDITAEQEQNQLTA